MRCAVPVRSSIRDLLTDLLSRKVTLRDSDSLVLSESRSAMLATYRTDDGGMAATAAWDFRLAALSGAAIGMVPAADAQLTEEGLSDDLSELFHEVVNVFARLLNSPTTPHVALRDLYEVPGEVATDVAELVRCPATRSDYQVDIADYGTGTLALLAGLAPTPSPHRP